ncbi:MAG: D-aminoacyl-tRNA deacylase [Lysobacteraceae bacterium]
MIALIQRVREAKVEVAGRCVGRIGGGLLALTAVQPGDDDGRIRRMCERLLNYRVFADEAGRMNRSLAQTGGGLLLVPQFTLAADTRKGLRPSFTSAAPPAEARAGFDRLLALAREQHPHVSSGEFGADMQVSLVNDGPVTFWLET